MIINLFNIYGNNADLDLSSGMVAARFIIAAKVLDETKQIGIKNIHVII